MYEQRLQGRWHQPRVGNILSYAGVNCMLFTTLIYLFVSGAVSREDQLHPSSHGYGAGAVFFGIGWILLLLIGSGWIFSLLGLIVAIRESSASENEAREELQSLETQNVFLRKGVLIRRSIEILLCAFLFWGGDASSSTLLLLLGVIGLMVLFIDLIGGIKEERDGFFVGGFLIRLGIVTLLFTMLLLILIIVMTSSSNWKDTMDIVGPSFLLLVTVGVATLLVGLVVALLEKWFGSQVEDFLGRASIGIILLVLLLQILPLSNASNSYNVLSEPFSFLQLVIVVICFMLWLTDLILWSIGRAGSNQRIRREEQYAEERWHGLQAGGFLSRMGMSIAFFFLLMEGSFSLLNPFWWLATTGLVILLIGLMLVLRGRLVRRKFMQDARERPGFVEGQDGSQAKDFLSRIGIDILLLLTIVVGFTLIVNAWSGSNLVNNANIYSIWAIFVYPLPFFAATECIISVLGLIIGLVERSRKPIRMALR